MAVPVEHVQLVGFRVRHLEARIKLGWEKSVQAKFGCGVLYSAGVGDED